MSDALWLLPAGSVTRSAFKTFRLTATVGLLAYIACKGETVDPSVATTITANSSTTLTGAAGSQVSPAPSILVKDQNGAPMAGATVNLLILTGGGTVSSATVTTNASGVATAAWTLGTTVGNNALNMWSGTLTAITFTATATAGAASSLTKSAGDNQAGTAGLAAPVAPSVVVKDANGNVTADVVVTFAVATGGGSVTGGTATSNALGIATVGSWILGASGTNTLTASAPGVPTVTFTATATPNVCASSTAHTLGGTNDGALATTDCLSGGYYIDFFTTTLAEANAYLFRQSAAFDTYLVLGTPDGAVIAENDDDENDVTTTNSAIKALLPPGAYVLGASSFDPAITGNYAVTSSTTSTDARGCELVFVVKNVSTSQNIETTDCNLLNPAAGFADHYIISLTAGQSVTISMSSTALDSFLTLRQLTESSSVTVATNDNEDTSGTKDARITYTATATTYFAIFAMTAVIGSTGSYTLQIQ